MFVQFRGRWLNKNHIVSIENRPATYYSPVKYAIVVVLSTGEIIESKFMTFDEARDEMNNFLKTLKATEEED